MEAAGDVRRTGLRRRRAGTHHASHADIVLGSRCIALHCTHSIDWIRTQAAGFFSYRRKCDHATNDAVLDNGVVLTQISYGVRN